MNFISFYLFCLLLELIFLYPSLECQFYLYSTLSCLLSHSIYASYITEPTHIFNYYSLPLESPSQTKSKLQPCKPSFLLNFGVPQTPCNTKTTHLPQSLLLFSFLQHSSYLECFCFFFSFREKLFFKLRQVGSLILTRGI